MDDIYSRTDDCSAALNSRSEMKKLILFALIIGLFVWALKDPAVEVADGSVSFGYIVKYSGDADPDETLPLLIALHGNGDTANNFYLTALDHFNAPARIVLLKGPLSNGSGRAWPWNPAEFRQYGAAVNEAIESLAVEYPTVGKPLLLGFSGGAMMAYYQAVRHGNSYSYIFPVSGQLSDQHLPDETVRSGAEVFAFHGKLDRVISINKGKIAVDLLRDRAVPVQLTEFDGNHHGIFTNMKPTITRLIEKKMTRLAIRSL